MRRLTALSLICVLSLLAMALDAPVMAELAQAPPPTCHGKTATIMGTQSQQITGTDGDDVVVTRGAASVDAGPGDDTVCVTGFYPPGLDGAVGVYDGSGSDLIDTTASRNPEIETFLGEAPDGSEVPNDDVDTFVGGPQIDIVRNQGRGVSDISTGAGRDQVQSDLRGAGLTVDLGPDVDSFFSEDVVTDRRGDVSISGGGDRDYLGLRSASAGSWVVDNRLGVLALDGDDYLYWSGMEVFWVDLPGQTTFFGDDAGEELDLGTSGQTAAAAVTMGGGNDEVYVEPNAYVLDGGEGSDTLNVSVYYGRGVPRDPDFVHLDLSAETLDFGAGRRASAARDFENAVVGDRFDPIVVLGTAGANRLRADNVGCDIALLGRGGDDRLDVFDRFGPCVGGLRTYSGGGGNDSLLGTSGDDVLYGGVGDDRLFGYAGNDVLNAGEGSDSANGGSGSDRCRHVETVDGCER